MQLVNGHVTLPKASYTLSLDFGPWLEKLKYDQYVLVHSQDRPVGQRLWGVLMVNGNEVSYQEVTKIESHQPHEGWKLSESTGLTPELATVYPACQVRTESKGTIVIESIGFQSEDKATE